MLTCIIPVHTVSYVSLSQMWEQNQRNQNCRPGANERRTALHTGDTTPTTSTVQCVCTTREGKLLNSNHTKPTSTGKRLKTRANVPRLHTEKTAKTFHNMKPLPRDTQPVYEETGTN